MSKEISKKIAETLIKAGTTFRADQMDAYEKAIVSETNERAKWVLETILENAKVAQDTASPLCDDTGIPHVLIEIGKDRCLSGAVMAAIQEGIAAGLRAMPGRPMALRGDAIQRLEQSGGIDGDAGAVLPAPFLIKSADENDVLRVHILLYGGGPAIRGQVKSVFHKHCMSVVIDEIVTLASEGVSKLGCTPCTLSIGIGRSQFEATALMMEAQVYGKYDIQNDLEKEITSRVNAAGPGPLGLGGDHSVLATFLRVGSQRASGVRIVSIRPDCCFEPRVASLEL
jgi:fumarate hydratase subunit alpha